jgi:hypothetical protein
MKYYLQASFLIIFVGSFFLNPSNAFGTLPDTGQIRSFTDTFGEDSDYSINPQSYTKLSQTGDEMEDTATIEGGWLMTRDNVTGLIWEIKTDDGSIHDKDNWYIRTEMIDYISTLNDSNFGGYSDWRVPTIKELATIVYSNSDVPAIDLRFFPNIQSYPYWSSTYRAYFPEDNPWFVNFQTGHVFYEHYSSSHYILAVRGTQLNTSTFIDNGNGTVTDISTGLMWEKTSSWVSKNWENALNYCENLSLADYDDWRLPNRTELQSILDYSRSYPAIDNAFFPNSGAGNLYWTSTSNPREYTNNAWSINFNTGEIDYYSDKTSLYYVRAVRTLGSDPNSRGAMQWIPLLLLDE